MKNPRLINRGGFWHLRWTEERNGRTIDRKKSLKTTDEAEARLFLQGLLDKIKEGKLIAMDRPRHIRVSEFMKEYLDGTPILPDRTQELAPGTIKNDRLAFKLFMERCGDLKLWQVKRNTVDAFKKRLAKEGKAPGYVNILLRSLRGAFSAAKFCGYIERNPFASIKELGKAGKVLIDLGKKRPRFLTDEEIGRIVKVITDRIQAARDGLLTETREYERYVLKEKEQVAKGLFYLVHFALFTGLRRSELVRLTWKDVDLEAGLIRVVIPEFNRNGEKGGRTKDNEEREVPILPALADLIKEMGPKDIGPVFARWRNPNTMSRMFKEVAEKAGVNKTFHGLRHSFGSWAAMSGVHIRSIQECMGHADIAMTRKYTDLAKEALKEDLKKLRIGNYAGTKLEHGEVSD